MIFTSFIVFLSEPFTGGTFIHYNLCLLICIISHLYLYHCLLSSTKVEVFGETHSIQVTSQTSSMTTRIQIPKIYIYFLPPNQDIH